MIQSTNSLENTNLETTKVGLRTVELLCPKCKQKIPSIEEIMISSKKAAMVKFNCQCLDSNKMETVDLGEYMHFLSLIDHNQYVCFKHSERTASVFCKNCSLHLCSECRSYHIAFTPNHVTYIHEEKGESQFCFSHSTCLLDLYCENCNDNLCIECAKRYHFNHKVMKLKEYWGRVNNKFANKTHEEITGFMNSQITSLESFIQKEVERISSIIFTLQQLKTKLEHKVKRVIKTNRTIEQFISCIFSDFYKGEFSCNFMIIQNIERIMFEELLSLKEKNIILNQFSIIEESINALFHYDKECLNRTIAKIMPRKNSLNPISKMKINKSNSLSTSQSIHFPPQLVNIPLIQPMQKMQPIQSSLQIQSIQSLQQIQPIQSMKPTPPAKDISSPQADNQMSSSLYWANKDAKKKMIQTPISLQLTNGEIGKKIINKEEILKSFNFGFNSDITPHINQDTLNQDHTMFLQNKKKREPSKSDGSNMNPILLKHECLKKRGKGSNQIKEPMKLKTAVHHHNHEYFKIGKEKKINKQDSSLKRPKKSKDKAKDKAKDKTKEKNKAKPNNNVIMKYDFYVSDSKQEEHKNKNSIWFECHKSSLKQSKNESSPEKNNKLKLDLATKDNNDDAVKESKFFSNNYEENLRENEFNFFNKGYDEYSPVSKANNMFSEFKVPVINNQFEQCITTITEHKSSVKAISQLSNGYLISGGNDNVVNIYNNENGFELTSKISTNDNEIYCLLELFDGNIAIGLNDNSIKIYDLSSTACCQVLIGHSKPVIFLFQKAIETLLSCSDDCSIKMWDLNTKNCLFTYNEHIDGVTGLLRLNDSSMLSVSKDSTLKQWRYSESKSIYTIKAHSSSITMIIKLFDENQLATASSDKTIKVWDFDQKKCLGTLLGHRDQVSGIIQLTDGTLASVSYDATLRIWDLQSLSCINSIIISSKRVNVLIQLSNGSIATGAEDSFIKIWV